MKDLGRFGAMAASILALAVLQLGNSVKAAGGPAPGDNGPYRVLAPIESGNLLLFPVVRADDKSVRETPFITLDEGLKRGEVEVTEAGKAQRLVRPRGGSPILPYGGDQVNTLVLVNHSKRPLLLLAGEVVTGGKQDRIVAKDRIVPADADPIDLSVFCIEPGRWTESSAIFHASSKSAMGSFMVQPEVREKAMVDQDQQQVWNSVHGAIAQMEVAAAPPASTSGGAYGMGNPRSLGTTSYAKVMQSDAVSEKVDQAAAPIMSAREQMLAKLRDEHAVGVVVAVRGQIIWADLFTNTDLLSRYWTKLVRSYAAESLTSGEGHAKPSAAEAQHFLDAPANGTEDSQGEVGVYRYRELKSDGTETFVLESLLPGTGYDVHISKMKLRGEQWRTARPQPIYPPPIFRPEVFRPETQR
jgi:ARG and Rhodanese-Phosphatase-superfamily-associated Protein domain